VSTTLAGKRVERRQRHVGLRTESNLREFGGQDFRQNEVDSTADPADWLKSNCPLLRIAPIDLQL